MKFYKMLFFMSLIMGTLISICSYSWLGMWMGLEINMISIMPLFTQMKNMLSSESSIKYFLTQTLASMMILFSIIILSINSIFYDNLNMPNLIIMNSALLTKMGAAPFHFWFPEIMEGLNWTNCLILLTWQKIAPMILIMYNSKMNLFLISIIIMSMIISSIMGFNQISLRKILTFSSINHIGWMISALMNNKTIWLIYFIVYSIISINIVYIFNKMKIFFMNQLIHKFKMNFLFKMFFIMNFFSLGGIPPFLGFLPKWLVINNLINNNQLLLMFIMIIFTLMVFYFYMRTMFSTLIINHNNSMINNEIKLNNFFMILTNFFSITALIIFPMLIFYF